MVVESHDFLIYNTTLCAQTFVVLLYEIGLRGRLFVVSLDRLPKKWEIRRTTRGWWNW